MVLRTVRSTISERLALCYKALKKPGKGGRKDRIQCAYFGFDSQERAEQFARYLKARFLPFAPRLVIRESDRLSECAWEVKVWEFPALLEIVMECAVLTQQQAA
jgi:hypothetical protein